MPPIRLPKGGNSLDYQMMFLGDVDAYTRIVDQQALIWEESSEKFVPANVITQSNIPPIGLRNRIVCIGDSITAGYPGQMTDYPRWLAFLTGGYVLNAGIAGNTLAQVIARLSTDVIAHKPGICVIMAGTNDIGETDLYITSSMKSITLALLQAGILPIWCTITSRSDYPSRVAQIRRVNMWLMAHVQEYGLPLADMFSATSQSDGTPSAGYLVDGLHPSTIGAVAMANAVYAVLPDTSRRTVPWRLPGDTENLFANGDFVLDGDSDGVPDSWGATGDDGLNTTWSLSAHPSDGQWWEVEKVATVGIKQGGGYIQMTLEAGATYRVAFDFEMSFTAGESSAVAYFSHVGSSQVDFIINNPQLNTATGYRAWLDFTVPSDATGSQFTFYGLGTAAFTIKIGRAMLFKIASTL